MHFVQRTPMFTNSRSTMGPGGECTLGGWKTYVKKVFRPKMHFLPCWLPYFQDIYQHTFVLYLYKWKNIPVCPGLLYALHYLFSGTSWPVGCGRPTSSSRATPRLGTRHFPPYSMDPSSFPLYFYKRDSLTRYGLICIFGIKKMFFLHELLLVFNFVVLRNTRDISKYSS